MDCTSSEQQLIFCMPTYLSCQKAILDLIAGWKTCPHLESKLMQGYLNKLVLVPTLSFSLSCSDFFPSLAFISLTYLWQAVLISLDLCLVEQINPILLGPTHITNCSAVQIPTLPSNQVALGQKTQSIEQYPRRLFCFFQIWLKRINATGNHIGCVI